MIWNAYSESETYVSGISVKSCGHIFAKEGRQIIRPDGRPDWLLFYIAKGSETFYFDKEETAKAGSFIIFAPGEKQIHIHNEKKTAEFYYIHFVADESFDAFGIETSKIYSPAPSASICDLFEEILTELQLKNVCYGTVCGCKFSEILSKLKRKTVNSDEKNREEHKKIAHIVQYMYKNYQTNESLDEYAAMCAMSKFHFIRMFEQVTGESPVSYKIKIRISHAKELLEDPTLTVGDIGRHVGYSSPSYFCDAFKKEVGISPMSYRKQKLC